MVVERILERRWKNSGILKGDNMSWTQPGQGYFKEVNLEEARKEEEKRLAAEKLAEEKRLAAEKLA